MGDLTEYLHGGWGSIEPEPGKVGDTPRLAAVGYYEHNGYVYLTGQITNQPPGSGAELEAIGLVAPTLLETRFLPWPAVDQTIMTGFPSELCPQEDVAIVLPINPERTLDVARTESESLLLGNHFPTTMHPDGTWTFDDALPDILNTPPSENRWWFMGVPLGEEPPVPQKLPQFPNPLILTLVIGNARWPVAGGADTYKTKILRPYLSGHFIDVDSAYAIHGSRVHLAGSVVNDKQAGPTVLLHRGPPGCYAAVEEGHTAFDGEATTAVGTSAVPTTAPELIPLLVVDPFENPEVEILSDQPIHGPAQDRPLARGAPVRSYYGGGAPGQTNHTVNAGVREDHKVVVGPEYACSYNFALTPPTTIYALGGVQYADLHFDLPGALEDFFPLPLWFEVSLEFAGQRPSFGGERNHPWAEIIGSFPDGPDAGVRASSGCLPFKFFPPEIGPTYDVIASPDSFIVTGATLPPGDPYVYFGEEEERAGAPTPEGPHWSGPLLPEGVSASQVDQLGSKYRGVCFPGEENKPYGGRNGQLASRLWRHDQAVPISVHFTSEIGWGVSSGTLRVTPYYETRNFGMEPDETLDLTLTGWRANAGEVNIGPGAKGIVPREG